MLCTAWKEAAVIEVLGLSKRYGRTLAVDDLSFDVLPGRVTGFLGPNGAGKSTTMRMMLGLDRPSAGEVRVGGRPYREHRRPLFEVGAVLESRALHGGRRAYHHLLALAQSNGIPAQRVEQVLDFVGLDSVARRRAGGFSLGMSQRLGLAAALLGDPSVVLCDEPVNGLDPEGIHWVRGVLRDLAAQGRTVFVSSHLMSEMALTADHLIVIGRGRLLADAAIGDVLAESGQAYTRVRSGAADRLAALLRESGARVDRMGEQELAVRQVPMERIGELAAAHAIALHELSAQQPSLEEAFLEITEASVQFRSAEVVR